MRMLAVPALGVSGVSGAWAGLTTLMSGNVWPSANSVADNATGS